MGYRRRAAGNMGRKRIGPYVVFSAAATPEGQDGVQFWVHEKLLPDPKALVVAVATPSVLIATLTVAGHRADGGIAVLNGSKAVQTRSQASRRPFN